MTDEHWEDLLVTINFTDRAGMIGGLRYHADYGGLSVKNMRAVLSAIGSVEPSDRSQDFMKSPQVRVTECSGGKFVGMWTKDEQSVWAAVHGLEDHLFKRDRNGHLRFSPKFLAEKETTH